jgi:hypothetical protein
MAQVIVIHDNKAFTDTLQININTYWNADVIPLSTIDAIKLMDILPRIDMVVVKNKIDKENTALTIVNHIKNTQLDPIVIVVGSPDALIKNLCITVNDNDWQSIITLGIKALKINSSKLKNTPHNKYIPIRCEYFLPLTVTPCNVFIRIKKNNSEFQFVKRFHANDSYRREDVEKYIKRGIKFFYIPTDFKEIFATMVSNQLMLKIDNDSTDREERIRLIDESFNLSYLLIKDNGFLTSTIQLVDSVVGAMANDIKNIHSKDLAIMLTNILHERNSFAFRYAFLVALIASNTLESTFSSKWTEDQKRVISFVAFFSDITLDGNHDLITINSQQKLETAALPPETYNKVMNHATDATTLCLEYPNFPPSADVVIREHHLSVDGIGFTPNLKNLLHPISMILYVSEKFTSEIIQHYKENRTFFASKVLDKMKEDPNNSQLLGIIQALKSGIVG